MENNMQLNNGLTTINSYRHHCIKEDNHYFISKSRAIESERTIDKKEACQKC